MNEETVNCIQYFWQEKGNLERWVKWEDRLPELQESSPHLVDAWFAYKRARQSLSLIVESLSPSP